MKLIDNEGFIRIMDFPTDSLIYFNYDYGLLFHIDIIRESVFDLKRGIGWESQIDVGLSISGDE